METEIKQYQLVIEAREVIFQFCESLSGDDYIKTVENFGQKSIRNTQTHIVNSYIHWIANYTLNRSLAYLNPDTLHSVDMMRKEYNNVNEWINEFLDQFCDKPNEVLANKLGKHGVVETTPHTLFTHVITHEFHHKGQLVSMARASWISAA